MASANEESSFIYAVIDFIIFLDNGLLNLPNSSITAFLPFALRMLVKTLYGLGTLFFSKTAQKSYTLLLSTFPINTSYKYTLPYHHTYLTRNSSF